jgi:hypothetical protein
VKLNKLPHAAAFTIRSQQIKEDGQNSKSTWYGKIYLYRHAATLTSFLSSSISDRGAYMNNIRGGEGKHAGSKQPSGHKEEYRKKKRRYIWQRSCSHFD